MAKIDGTEEEEQYATAAEVDGIRRTLDQFMKRQDASNEAMKKSLDDVLLSLSKLSVSAVEDKGSSFKGKKPQNPRPDHTHIPSTYGQDHYPEDINGMHHDTIFVEYDMEDCPWTFEEMEKIYECATVPSHGPTPPPATHHTNRQQHHQVQPPQAHQVFFHPEPQFQTQLHVQHRAVAKGPNFPFQNLMDLMLMVGSGKLRNTLSWFEFLMKKEFKLLFFTLKAKLNSGGEAQVAVLLIYHGINSVNVG